MDKEYDAYQNELPQVDKSTASTDKKVKPHIIRRNVEDYLEKRALEERLRDVFEEDF